MFYSQGCNKISIMSVKFFFKNIFGFQTIYFWEMLPAKQINFKIFLAFSLESYKEAYFFDQF
jgi:hypothetical protein